MKQLEKLKNIESLIAKTPMLKIEYKYKGKNAYLFAKAENYNLTGSIKDRVAFCILRKAYEKGQITPETVIAEATSGNMGISFCALGSYLGHKVKIYMPAHMSVERIQIMRAYGAEVNLVSPEQGGFIGAIEITRKLAEQGGVFLPRQFSNPDNVASHLNTGEEIATQLNRLDVLPEVFVAGVGTGGTIMGVSHCLREYNPDFIGLALEPANSPTLSMGYKVGSHRIQGISDDFVPEIVKLDELDGIVSVDDGDSINMSRMLCEDLGLGVGISAGANFLGCVKAAQKYGAQNIVTVFPDDNKKYLSTDYAKQQPEREDFLSKDIELIGVHTYRY